MAAKKLNLTAKDVELLNAKIGMKHLLAKPRTNVADALKAAKCEIELRDLQAKLVSLQRWAIENDKRIVIVFEGRDAAGKGGAIRRIAAHINPRHFLGAWPVQFFPFFL